MLHNRKAARSKLYDMKAFKDSGIPLSCSQGSREVWTLRDIPTQGKQLDQQSKTTNCRRKDPAEPCSRESGGTSEHDEGRLDPPGPPPAGGGAAGVQRRLQKTALP